MRSPVLKMMTIQNNKAGDAAGHISSPAFYSWHEANLFPFLMIWWWWWWWNDQDGDAGDDISNNDDDDVWQIVIIGERTFLHRVLSTLKSLPRSFGLNHLHIIIIVIIVIINIIVVVIFIILINLLTAQEGESPLWIYTLCHQPVISSSRLTFVISHIFILFTAEIFFRRDCSSEIQRLDLEVTGVTMMHLCNNRTTNFYSWKIFS